MRYITIQEIQKNTSIQTENDLWVNNCIGKINLNYKWLHIPVNAENMSSHSFSEFSAIYTSQKKIKQNNHDNVNKQGLHKKIT